MVEYPPMSPERSIERIGGGLMLSGYELLNPPAPLLTVVLQDLDDTTFNTSVCAVSVFKKLLAEELGKDVDINLGSNYVHKWNQLSDWAIERGVLELNAEVLQSSVWEEDGLYQMIELMAGAFEMAEWFVNSNIDFRFHTSREPILGDATHRNIKEHFPEIYLPSNIDIRLSDAEDRSSFKPENTIKWVKKYGRVVFIDDNPHDTENMLKATEGLEVYGIFVHHSKVNIGEYLFHNNRLIAIPCDFNDRGLWGVYEYLTGLEAPISK